MRVVAVALAMAAALALVLGGASGCKKKDAWEDYVGSWTDPGGQLTAGGSRLLPWTLTIRPNGSVTFHLETTLGGWWSADNMPAWSDDSLVYDETDTDGDQIRVVVSFLSGNRAGWVATGNLNWCPVSGTLSR